MKKFICAAAIAAVGIMSIIGFGGCNAGEAHVEYTLSEDGTYYIVSGVSGDKRGLTKYDVPAEYAKEGGELLPVKEIGAMAFRRCTSLRSVTIPDTVTKISYASFSNCESLTEITIPESVTALESSAFSYCPNLKTAYVKAEITVLEDKVFYNSVASFGGSSYSNTALTKVYLPATLEKIHIEALRGNSITDIYFAGSEEQWNDLYFYDMVLKQDNNDEYEEKRYKKKDVLHSSVNVHYNVQF